jgi:stage V sporulation protein AE
MEYIKVFFTGGILCAIGQILIDRTKLTPARILTGYLLAGFVLTALDLYQPLVEWGGAGATVPLLGFGYLLAKGTRLAVIEDGFLGAFSGGITATAAGIAASVFFGFLASLIFNTHEKK